MAVGTIAANVATALSTENVLDDRCMTDDATPSNDSARDAFEPTDLVSYRHAPPDVRRAVRLTGSSSSARQLLASIIRI
ncbi:MAG: hypothetical protein QM784_05360 [Polyangiaceae bacterium]